MIVQPKRIEAFLAKPDPGISTFLVYGPDRGIVVQRVEALLARLVSDPKDPFLVGDLPAERVAQEPRLLLEEAQSMSLLGGQRVVRVRDADDRVKAAVRDLFKLDAQESYVLLEAGELPSASDLRKSVEKAAKAAAIACYRDEGRGLEDVLRTELQRHGLVADRDALHALQASLGADRAVTVAEIEKLALYVGGVPGSRVTLEDVCAVIGNSGVLTLDDLILDVLIGASGSLAADLERLLAEGGNEIMIVNRLSAAFGRLIRMRTQVDGGASADQVVEALFWKVRDPWKRALGRWSTRAAQRGAIELLELDLRLKGEGGPPRRELLERVLFVLCDPRLRSGHAG
ncbi:MAG TPA: DNA polymerase III subunit delta [Geminicoccus sp.]|uniref:DNA polymerase III subunit delta n=1 Tax=Geminicoccus sp. TaxID=2024832 RepID=UPI002E38052D|nr:DNA polymerase III subunit delta [Geminicoccus sp.]HEX2529320.1 DNA polymerase III subunit delta [Geminicoccus sp.]